MEDKQELGKTKELIKKISSGDIKQHSKTYFRLRFVLLTFLTTFIFVISAFLCSFIFFKTHSNGQFSLIGFGSSGTMLFFKFFPWIMFFVNILLIAIVGYMIQTFCFGYKTPAIYLGLGIILAMTLSGIIIEKITPIHYILWQNAQNKNLPVVGAIYRHACTSLPAVEKIFRGKISSLQENFIEVNIQSGKCGSYSVLKVLSSNSSWDKLGIKNLKLNDNVFIEGEIRDGIIYAENIKKTPILLDFLK